MAKCWRNCFALSSLTFDPNSVFAALHFVSFVTILPLPVANVLGLSYTRG